MDNITVGKRSQNLIGFVNDLEVISKKYEKLPGLITTNSLVEFIKLGEFGKINQLDKKAKEISIKEVAKIESWNDLQML